jgi:hypothetical protein
VGSKKKAGAGLLEANPIRKSHPFNRKVQSRPVRFSLMYFPAFFNKASIKPSVDKKIFEPAYLCCFSFI